MTNKLIVIGGLPRSGSTLLRFLLDSSETILAGPETNFFRFPLWQTQERVEKVSERLSRKLELDLADVKLSIQAADSSVEAFKSVMRLYAESTDTQKAVFAEKSPNNCYAYNRLAGEDKDLYFVSTIRSGLDVVTSKIDGHPRRSGYWCSVQRYVDDCNAIYSFDHEKHFVWKYEDAVSNPMEQAEKLFNFLDEPFSEMYLQKMVLPSKTRSLSKVNQPKLKQAISTEWIERWRLPEHAKKVREFCADERALYWLAHTGYEVAESV